MFVCLYVYMFICLFVCLSQISILESNKFPLQSSHG